MDLCEGDQIPDKAKVNVVLKCVEVHYSIHHKQLQKFCLGGHFFLSLTMYVCSVCQLSLISCGFVL